MSGPQAQVQCLFLGKQQAKAMGVENFLYLGRVNDEGQFFPNPSSQGAKAVLLCLLKNGLRLTAFKASP